MSKRKISDYFSVPKKRSHEEIEENVSLVSHSDPIAETTTDLPSTSKVHTFQQSWLNVWPWLNKGEKGMTCDFCIAHGMSNTFTSGCINYRTSTLSRHAASTDHKTAIVARTSSQALKKTVEIAISKKEGAVISAIETVYWLSKVNIATLKYPSLLEFLEKQGCSVVKDLNSGKNATYKSRQIAEEMQQAIADTLQNDIIEDLKKAPFISIMTDESTDISVTGKLIFYVRFVDQNFNVRSHFLGELQHSGERCKYYY